MPDLKAEILYDARCKLGEGPVWHDDALWFVDIEGKKIHRLKDGKLDGWDVGELVGFAVPTTEGRFVIGRADGLFFWSPDNEPEPIVDPQTGDTMDTRFNDAKVSPQGRLFAGTMVMRGPRNSGHLYRVDANLSIRSVVEGVQISNGLDWSVDGKTMWYADTPTGRVDRFDHDPSTGEIRNRRELVKDMPGGPDGLCADADDRLYIAQWGGSCVLIVDGTTGEHLGKIEVGVPNVTSCCFGGPDLRSLYITCHQAGGEGGGGIWFVKDVGVVGKAVTLFNPKRDQ